jgi:hypothetical protein
MNTQRLSPQLKVRQCSRCQLNTESYCNTCKCDLYVQCKEKHVIDLHTKHHDVVIYRDKRPVSDIQTDFTKCSASRVKFLSVPNVQHTKTTNCWTLELRIKQSDNSTGKTFTISEVRLSITVMFSLLGSKQISTLVRHKYVTNNHSSCL